MRIKPGDLEGTLSFLEGTLKHDSTNEDFSYNFLDQKLETYYRRDETDGVLFAVLSGLGILISCLGLLGLTIHATEQRAKELGIRKVLGASGSSLRRLLRKELSGIVIIANLIAWPAAYFAMNRWLQDFAYRIDIRWWVFALSGSIVLMVALLTISYHSLRAVRANPVDALTYE
jgi:putative ABC transport system permease protein